MDESETDAWVIVGKVVEGEFAVWAARREKMRGSPTPTKAIRAALADAPGGDAVAALPPGLIRPKADGN